MFPINPNHVRRVAFTTKLYPKIKSTLGLDVSKLKSVNQFDGDTFCGGRSKNRDLLTFFGLIAPTQRGSSTFVQLTLFRRCIKKITDIVEQELSLAGAHEVLLPTLLPQKLWDQSRRCERQQDALDHVYNFTDKSGNKLLLGPTFEESITKLIGDLEPITEADLPLLLYQTSNKFRFEPNPRFGLIRSNEFLMNDLYSFDSTIEKAKLTYEMISQVYDRLFRKLGMECKRFENQTGGIGGKLSHEYQFPVSSGEDSLVQCSNCGCSYNAEMSTSEGADYDGDKCMRCKSTNIDKVQALELGHTFLLSDTYSHPMKVTVNRDDGSKVNFQMGCYGLGLSRIIAAALDHYSMMPEQDSSKEQNFVQMRWPIGAEPFKIAIVAPATRSKQHHAGSTDFIERIVNKILDSTHPQTDILVEDRGKEGILKRIFRLQSLGIPNIIVVGQRFLQEQPEVELMQLGPDRKQYTQHWFTEDQICDFVRGI